MARIAGIELPSQKRVEIGLTYIYGIGKSSSNEILYEAGVNPDTRVKELTESEINTIQTIIQRNFRVEGELRRIVQGNIKRLIDIGSYRGLRHRRGLPARGQRTRTNARTKRGRRKTVGTVKKEAREEKG
ncbi:MAG: 30S ribosomal protein S13 [bacterium]